MGTVYTDFKKNTDQFILKKWAKRNDYSHNNNAKANQTVLSNSNPEVKTEVPVTEANTVNTVSIK